MRGICIIYIGIGTDPTEGTHIDYELDPTAAVDPTGYTSYYHAATVNMRATRRSYKIGEISSLKYTRYSGLWITKWAIKWERYLFWRTSLIRI